MKDQRYKFAMMILLRIMNDEHDEEENSRNYPVKSNQLVVLLSVILHLDMLKTTGTRI